MNIDDVNEQQVDVIYRAFEAYNHYLLAGGPAGQKPAYYFASLSVCLSVCPSVCRSVSP